MTGSGISAAMEVDVFQKGGGGSGGGSIEGEGIGGEGIGGVGIGGGAKAVGLKEVDWGKGDRRWCVECELYSGGNDGR